MATILGKALSFDDVMLSPRYSCVESRGDVSLSVPLSKGIKLDFPVFPANMKSVIGETMIKKMYEKRMLSLMHRFLPYEDIIKYANTINSIDMNMFNYIGFSVGVKKEDYVLASRLINIGAKIICVDVAHGDHSLCHDMTHYISTNFPEIFLISGNVATEQGAFDLYNCGADAVKVNIGAGSTCSTRIETGNGIPMVTALINAGTAKRLFKEYTNKDVFIISDGACRHVGDICKALCFADLVMTGNMFAGTDETPEELIEIQNVKYKRYAGSSTHKGSRVEGVSAVVPYKGPIDAVLKRMAEGIQSCCSYQGVSEVSELNKVDAQFVEITNSGLQESHPHDLVRIVQ